MKKEQLSYEVRPLKSNLLLQDCFLRDSVPPKDIHRGNKEHVYYELVREVKPEGVIETMREMPYPHTIDSVKSYLDAVDYRTDPLSAIHNGLRNPRKNLGDVRETQKVMSLDSQAARALFEELAKAFAKAKEEANKNEEAPAPAPSPAPAPAPIVDGGK